MTAYNRITQQFQDGLNVSASDFNAMIADLKTLIFSSGGSGGSGGTTLPGEDTADNTTPTADQANLTADAG